MKSGSNAFSYQLYVDSAYTTVLTLSPANGTFYTPYSNSTGANINTTIYARISGSQTAPPGTYNDSYSGTSQALLEGNLSNSQAGSCLGGSSQGLSFSVTATINASCSISAGVLDFGSTPTTIATAISATATITPKCTNTTPYSIGLGTGANPSGAQNRMQLGATGYYLNYGLYTNSSHTHSWQTTTSASSCSGGASTCYLGTGTGTSQSVTVYGLVPSQTAPAAGAYSDTVIVTVTF